MLFVCLYGVVVFCCCCLFFLFGGGGGRFLDIVSLLFQKLSLKVL